MPYLRRRDDGPDLCQVLLGHGDEIRPGVAAQRLQLLLRQLLHRLSQVLADLQVLHEARLSRFQGVDLLFHLQQAGVLDLDGHDRAGAGGVGDGGLEAVGVACDDIDPALFADVSYGVGDVPFLDVEVFGQQFVGDVEDGLGFVPEELAAFVEQVGQCLFCLI